VRIGCLVIYESHLKAAEESAWPLESSIAWDAIDREVAATETDIHGALHDAALIEGYLPIYGARLIQGVWDDVDATAVLSIEMYEGLRHYTALKRYLEIVGYQTADASSEKLVAARARSKHVVADARDVTASLTHFMCSELFAAYFFLRLARRVREPVLKELLSHMSRDEFRHSAAARDVLKGRLDRGVAMVSEVLSAAEKFRHYGNDVVDVPLAEANDFEAIMAMNRKIQSLCGMALTEHYEDM
jgi:hypothetical protein